MPAYPMPSSVPHFGDLVAWANSKPYAVGQRVINGANVYVATTGGISAAGPATGPSGAGSGITDGTVVWDFVVAFSVAWAGTTAYTEGDGVTNDSGKLYLCIVGGVSAGSGGPTGTAGIISDGSVVWSYLSSAAAQQTTPTSRRADLGFIPGSKFPSGYVNDFEARVTQWLYYLRDFSVSDYGDGSDGSGTMDGAATIAGMAPSANEYRAVRDLFFQNLTINAGIKLTMQGFRLYVRGTLTLVDGAPGGWINADGQPGVLFNGGKSGGHAIGSSATGVLAVGGNGGDGGVPGGAGGSVSVTVAIGDNGGAGGAGTGGAGGTATLTAPTAANGSIRVSQSMLTGMLFGASGALAVNGGGGGGGGGGAAALNTGGPGGGGGGVLLIAAYAVSVGASCKLSANGAAGGAAIIGGEGGGGGGGGGSIVMRYHELLGPALPTTIASVLGGAGGAGSNANGSVGVSGNLYIAQI